ncbi:MAG: KEOPS complex subunit Pcc1 [Methanobacteriaceae archaeon]
MEKSNENKSLTFDSPTFDFIKTKINVDFENENLSKIIYDSLVIDVDNSPDYRSVMDLNLEGSIITININSQDITSFRASINSIIKLMILSKQIITINNSNV